MSWDIVEEDTNKKLVTFRHKHDAIAYAGWCDKYGRQKVKIIQL